MKKLHITILAAALIAIFLALFFVTKGPETEKQVPEKQEIESQETEKQAAEKQETEVSERKTLRIIATSDLHGKFYPRDYLLDEESPSGSMAQLAAAIAEYRTKDTILADAGDTIQDNAAEIFIDSGEVHPMIQAINALDYDVWVTGNHEYDYSMDTVKKTIADLKCKTLTGNVYDRDGSPIADGYTILEKSGVRIAVIGMVTPNIARWSASNLAGCTVTDPLEETRRIIDNIQGKYDVLVGVFHMGIKNEYGVPNSGVTDILNACPEFDVMVSSHEHALIPSMEINGTLVVQNKYQAQTMSVIDLTLEKESEDKNPADPALERNKGDGGWKLTGKSAESVTIADYEADPSLMELLSKYDARAGEDADMVIGRLEGGPLAPENETPEISSAIIQDTALIDLINDVQMHYSGAPVSAAMLTKMDTNMYPGLIRKCDAAQIYRFSNTLYKVHMTGAQLKKLMEWAAGFYNTMQPGDADISFNKDFPYYNYPMFEGVSYEINLSREPGSRIEHLSWPDGTPVGDEDVFDIVVNNYFANSLLFMPGPIYEADEIPVLAEMDVHGEIGGIREMILDYILHVKDGVIRPECNENWKLTIPEAAGTAGTFEETLPKAAENAGTFEETGAKTAFPAGNPEEVAAVILHTNDVHVGLEDNIGYDGLALYKKELEALYDHVLLIDAGDAIQGAAIGAMSRGEEIIKIMNRLGYDLAIPGNHEFDFGFDVLDDCSEQLDCGYTCANFCTIDGEPVFKPWRILEAGDLKIGFVGAVTPDTFTRSAIKDVVNEVGEPMYDFLADETGERLAAALQKSINEVRDNGADYVILAAHLGNGTANTSIYSSNAIVGKLTGLDMVIDGHSHEVYNTSISDKNGEQIPIAQTGTKMQNIGQLTIYKDGRLEENIIDLVPQSSGVPGESVTRKDVERYVDPDMKVFIDDIIASYDGIMSRKIGELSVDLIKMDENGSDLSRTGENGLCELAADAFRAVGGTQTALIGAGSVRTNLKAGEVTYKDIVDILPYCNEIIMTEVSGQMLLDALEFGVSFLPKKAGAFPQVSGITFRINEEIDSSVKMNEKKQFLSVDGEYRVSDVKIDGKDLDPEAIYTLAISQYLFTGGDGYTMFEDAEIISTTMLADNEVVMKYIAEDLNGVIPEKYAEPLGRIRY